MSCTNVPCHRWQLIKVRNRLLSESCRICMSHVTYKRVTSHMNESCHIWLSDFIRDSCLETEIHFWVSHVAYAWVTPHMNSSRHIRLSHVMYKCLLSSVTADQSPKLWCRNPFLKNYKCLGATSHENKSCHVWTSHVTCKRAMSRMKESCHVWYASFAVCEWVMSHVNESC